MGCCVSGNPSNRECMATIVQPGAGRRRSPGEEILSRFDEVADVEISNRGFDYYR
ncbi:MAG: hypothetical protein AB1898_31700 [Acidobacteriota bacterium]